MDEKRSTAFLTEFKNSGIRYQEMTSTTAPMLLRGNNVRHSLRI